MRVVPGAAPQAAAVAGLAVHPCTVDSQTARCGSLLVPEDRVSGTGAKLKVGFVVMPAVAADHRPDPVVYFSGGPGGSATADIPAQMEALAGLHLRHDIVFVDQRGTGKSNPLMCPPFPRDLADKAALSRSVRSCLAKVHANVGFYTTAMAVDDVADVLRALGYQKVDLFGGSYGATAVQVFLLRHPDMVRTMTMLGGTLLDVPIFERFPANAQAALDDVLARCRRSPTCHKAFPHTRAELASVLTSLSKAPWVVPAKLSPTKKTFYYTKKMAVDGLHQALLSAATEAYVPLLVHVLATTKDHATAILEADNALSQRSGAGGTAGNQDEVALIEYVIECAEPWARYDPSRVADRSSYEYGADIATAKWMKYVCSLMPASPTGAIYGPASPSSVPVLAFNGTADPQDPPSNMAGAARLWPASRVLAVPGQSHQIDLGTWSICAAGIVDEFVRDASTAHLGTSCLASVPSPPFVLSVSALAS